MRIEFTGTTAFEAFRKAEQWCRDHRVSWGSMQGPDPIGLLFGEVSISKWRNLSAQDKAELHGKMTGDMRNGPVVIDIDESKKDLAW